MRSASSSLDGIENGMKTIAAQVTCSGTSSEDLHLHAANSLLRGKRRQKRATKGKARAATRMARNRTKKRKWRPATKQRQRDADNSKILNLTLDVNDLHQQIYDYSEQRRLRDARLFLAREQYHDHVIQSIEHFFNIFRDGYPEVLLKEDARFLDELLGENMVVCGEAIGSSGFIEYWRRYKDLFHMRRLVNSSIKAISSDSNGCFIECRGQFEGFVTIAAMITVFPHILGNQPLTEAVLHRPLLCRTRTLISLDVIGRIIVYDAFVDVFDAMSALVGYNLIETAQLMSDAKIGEGGLLPPVHKREGLENDGANFGVAHENRHGVHGGKIEARSNVSKALIDFILSRLTKYY